MNSFLVKKNYLSRLFSLRISRGGDRYHYQKGFTLIEFLVYSILVTMLVGSLVLTGVNILEGRARLRAIEEVNHNGKMAIEKIAYYIRQAESINSPAQGGEAVLLSLEMDDFEKDPTVFEIGEDNVLTVKKGVESPLALTTKEVEVSFLKFTNVSHDNTPGTVRVELTMKHSSPREHSDDFSRTFSTTENIYR